jgi:hypothetical protein
MDKKICNVCNVEYDIDFFYQKGNCCKKCSMAKTKIYKSKDTGFLVKLIDSSKSNSIIRVNKGRTTAGKHEIVREDLEKLLIKQAGLCYYSNLPMVVANKSDWKCSIERLDESLGYLPENIVLCCSEFNGQIQWSKEKVQMLKTLSNETLDLVDF